MAVFTNQKRPFAGGIAGGLWNTLFNTPQPVGQGVRREKLMSSVVQPTYARVSPTPNPNITSTQPGYTGGYSQQGGIFNQFGKQIGSSVNRQTVNVPQIAPGTTTGDTQDGVTQQQSTDTGQTQDLSSLMQSLPAQPSIDFDALIAPAIEGLDAAIGPLQASTAATVGGIEARQGTQTAQAKAEFGAQEKGLGRAKETQAQLGESAANESRRIFAEIQQGIQARYGGTTGTGRFASEIAGTQTLRNIANIRQQVMGAIAGIDDKIQQVQEVGRIALQDIEEQGASQIKQAKAQLELSLADVRRQKGELQGRKAELATQAMKLYQNTVNNVNAQNAQFKQNLYLQQLGAENKLKLAGQRARQVSESFKLYDITRDGQTTPVFVGNRGTIQDVPIAGGKITAIGRPGEEEKEDVIDELIKQATGSLRR